MDSIPVAGVNHSGPGSRSRAGSCEGWRDEDERVLSVQCGFELSCGVIAALMC